MTAHATLSTDLGASHRRNASCLLLACVAASACGEPARVDGRTLAEHLASLDAPPPGAMAGRVRALAGFGTSGDAAVARLEDLLRGDPELSASAASALRGIGTAAAGRALLGALRDPAVAGALLGPIAEAALQCVPPAELASAIDALVRDRPNRAARLLVNDRAFDALFADASRRRAALAALGDRIEALDPRNSRALLYRLANEAIPATEALLERALVQGTAWQDAVLALRRLGTRAALDVVARQLVDAPPDRATVLLEATASIGASAPARAFELVRDHTGAGSPAVRAAAIDAAGVLGITHDELRAPAIAVISVATADAADHVVDTACRAWTRLVAGVDDPTGIATAWADAAIACDDPRRGARRVAALGGAAIPSGIRITQLARIGRESMAMPVAAAAERALATIGGSPAQIARATILVRTGIPDAARRARALVRDPATDVPTLTLILGALAAADAPAGFAATLLEDIDRRVKAETLTATDRVEILATLLDTDGVEPGMRAAAARRLWGLAPERATIGVTLDGRPVRTHLRADRVARASLDGVPADHAALLVLPRVGRLELPASAAGRAVVWLDAGFESVERVAATTAADDVRAALILPVGLAAAERAPTPGLPEALLRALAR